MATSTTTGTFNTQSIGTIRGLTGTATATDTQGATRTLQIGDVVFADEIIQTAAGSTVHIEFINGGYATVASDSTLALDNTVFDPEAQASAESAIASIQAQIAAGADPTEVVDPAAAGPEATQEGHTAVFVEQDAAAGALTPGFDTTTFATELVEPPEGAAIIVEDDAPIGGTTAAAVDEDDLPEVGNQDSALYDLNANIGDAPSDTSEHTFSGQLNFVPSDNVPNSVDFASMNGTSGTVGLENVNYAWDGTTLTATVDGGPRDGTPLFKVTITDSATGAFTVELLNNVIHAHVGDNENAVDPTTNLTYTITDVDGDTATGTLTITFDDDMPTTPIISADSSMAVIHDETPGLGDSPEDDDVLGTDYITGTEGPTVASLFAALTNTGDDPDVAGTGAIGYARSGNGDDIDGALVSIDVAGSPGADGGVTTYGLSVTGGNGSLAGVSTTEGTPIYLYLENGLIVGRVGGSEGAAAFAVTINPETGEVFTAQYLSLEHPDAAIPANSYDSYDEVEYLGAGAIEATVTITDGDGDFVSSNAIDVSGQIGFGDDGPDLTVTAGGSGSLENLGVELDETTGDADRYAFGEATDTYVNDDAGGPPPLAQVESTITGGLAALFTVADSAGADGTKSIDGTMSFIGLPTFTGLPDQAGLATNLEATDGGAIVLKAGNADGTIINGVDTQGDIVFTITITGNYASGFQLQTTQYEAIKHGNDGDDSFDESISLALGQSLSAIQLQYEVTLVDNDGDTITQADVINLITDNTETSYFSFDDDGPLAPIISAASVDVIHDETPGLGDSPEDDDVLGTDYITGTEGLTVASLFAGVANPGDDLDVDGTGAIGYARSGEGTSLVSISTAGDPGSDGLLSTVYGLSVTSGNGSPAGVSTTEGTQIFLYQENGLIVGRVGHEGGDDPDTANPDGVAAFAIAIDAGTGEVFTAQYLSLEHPDAAIPANSYDSYDEVEYLGAGAIEATVTITDGDGDFVSSNAIDVSGQIGFGDDGPSMFGPESIHILDDATTPDITRALNFDGHGGADGTDSVIFFQITQGEQAFDVNTQPLSFNGVDLYLYYGDDGSGGIDNTVLIASTIAPTTLGVRPAGVDIDNETTTAFWLDIDPSADTYTMHSNGIIENGSSLTATEADVISAGNEPFVVMDNLEDTAGQDVIITASANINTSQVIGTGNNWFATDQGIRFDLVKNADYFPKDGPTPSYFDYDEHNVTTAFRQEVVDVKAGGANITLAAINADDDNNLYPTSGDGDDVILKLYADNIRVWNGNELLSQGTDPDDDYYVVENGTENTVTVMGVLAGWTVEVTSTTAHPIEFEAIEITAAAGSADYRLGYFSYGVDYSGDPVPLQYTILGLDQDGDSVASVINATLYPNDGLTWVGGTGDDNYTDSGDSHYLLGDGGDDTIYGMGGDDILVGDIGSDHLYGGEGSDTLIGGSGDDTMDGGAGMDTASYSDTALGVTVDLSTGTATGEEIGTDTLSNIENVAGGYGDDTLIGDAGANILSGGEGNDILVGGEGNDTLTGGAGNDTLIGGQGSDTLSGDGGSDTFMFNAGDETGSPIDTITDFNHDPVASGGDVLNLSELLQGETANANTLGGYMSFSWDGSDTTLNIDVDGAGAGTAGQAIVFQGVDLTTYGSDVDIIQHLLDGGNLIVDDI